MTVRAAPDRLLLVSLGLLVLFGMSFVLSSSYHAGEVQAADSFFYFKRHLVAVVMALGTFFLGLRLNLDKVEAHPGFDRVMPILGLVACVVLAMVFLPIIGRSAGGSRRWIDLRVFQIQASEVAKVLLLFFLAHTLAKKKNLLGDLTKGFFPIMLWCLAVVGLIAIEPDLSTALLVLGMVFFLFYLAGTPVVYLAVVGVVALIAVIFLMQVKTYIATRFIFFNPWLDPWGKGYHLIQSFTAFAKGGLFGAGPGNSVQKMGRLPEAHTDFVFAIIGEEMGLFGGILVMALFGLLAWRGIRTALIQISPMRSYLAAGITYLIAVQALIHMAVNLGLMPTTGLPLPFISYGRSDMLVKAFLLGLLLNLSRVGAAPPTRPPVFTNLPNTHIN